MKRNSPGLMNPNFINKHIGMHAIINASLCLHYALYVQRCNVGETGGKGYRDYNWGSYQCNSK